MLADIQKNGMGAPRATHRQLTVNAAPGPVQACEHSLLSSAAAEKRAGAPRRAPEQRSHDRVCWRPGALMKYWNSPEWLAKVGGKLGDVTAAAAGARGAPPPAPAAPAAAPEVNTLLDAATCARTPGRAAPRAAWA